MSRETFPLKLFSYSTEYPTSGVNIALGNSYTFTAAPSAPDQRLFTIKFAALKYFLAEGGGIDTDVYADTLNLGTLEAFYNRHRLWKSFDFNHPIYGLVVVKFKDPLKVPEGVAGGGGAVKGLEIKLVEMP